MRQALSHLGGAGVLTMGSVAAVLWPCFPGSYDPLALPLSMVSRFVSWSLLVFAPIGVVWWCRDTFVGRPAGARLLGTVTVGAAVTIGAVVVLTAASFSGVLLALVSGAIVVILIRTLSPRWMRAAAGTEGGTAAVLYLVAVPGLNLVLHLWLFEPAVEANRARLMASAAPLIAQLEQYRLQRGNYPESLLSVTTDYRPRSVSVPRFCYERAGDAYNLAFEQPPAALDMREFVVFNPAGHAVLSSHDSDLLLFQGDDLERRRGFPSSADVPGHPGWRVFRFD
jgi:hypothetical protein